MQEIQHQPNIILFGQAEQENVYKEINIYIPNLQIHLDILDGNNTEGGMIYSDVSAGFVIIPEGA